MKKKTLITILCLCLFLNAFIVGIILMPKYKEYKENKALAELLANATIKVTLKEDMTTPHLSKVKVSDFIESINGKILDDFNIDTTVVGERTINFKFINDEDIKIPYKYVITVKDTTAPVIWVGSSKYIKTTYDGNLLEDITCADNYDDNPDCRIIGSYDTKVEGDYPLIMEATDKSGNKNTKKFTLRVRAPKPPVKPDPNKPAPKPKPRPKFYFTELIDNYKNENTKVGIDVSGWQGDIDFDAVKAAGVEFAFVRVGSTKGINGEYFVDKKFKQNMEGFKRVGIPTGVYFYSYANSKESAIRDANWVLKQIEGYDIPLGVAYDWESWSFYNVFHQSFYSTSRNAKAFLDTISKKGYKGLLYSSKNYLEKVWYDIGYDVWLAHYNRATSYKGPYKYWQIGSNGKVPGINGFVDLNIMFIEKKNG